MVHQLSLVSSIAHGSYVQTVSTLQAFTGMLSPQPIATYTLLTKPHEVFKPKFEPGKVNQIEQYYMKCITTWSDGSEFDLASAVIKENGSSNVFSGRLFHAEDESVQRIWTLQISDIPIAGKNQACSAQTIYESTLIHTHTNVKSEENKIDAMDVDLEHKDKSDVKGDTKEKEEDKKEEDKKEEDKKEEDKKEEDKKEEDKKEEEKVEKKNDEVKHSEVNLEDGAETGSGHKDSFLQFLEDLGYETISQYWIKGIRFFHGDIVIEIFKVLVRDDEVTEPKEEGKIALKLLDESNTFQIRTYINIAKSTDIDLINQGTKELLRLQEFLKNLFKLEIPDRMFMDSRVQVRK
ncbi:predicted protein [Scheffersomyces stipitis CBS 6054]|uniref:Mediator of RNA polymerase II transcription subunit 18 n=1 Tax=Scheffersomyces stipitis (strain ATCC 58785 / CBS 6054 / NBRC 10063 / NRRL Y-11545) TaxID=322104 RepID=MED18_PICST|nr:predicted protein [Scheffersomyces stipitis CBS 6054]A3LU54.2 RecName: Full=Mediator of RNA polymerase II transcription subunit 18; AltName: Full=Mediator complex subunit 18 [Scheffersomyces stipitis CBS 6054]ABN66182.2 predicted protein [Scheffersomyces stipitis CBS 6054]